MRSSATKLYCDFHNAAAKKNIYLIDATSPPKPLNLEQHLGRILLGVVLIAWSVAAYVYLGSG